MTIDSSLCFDPLASPSTGLFSLGYGALMKIMVTVFAGGTIRCPDRQGAA